MIAPNAGLLPKKKTCQILYFYFILLCFHWVVILVHRKSFAAAAKALVTSFITDLQASKAKQIHSKSNAESVSELEKVES